MKKLSFFTAFSIVSLSMMLLLAGDVQAQTGESAQSDTPENDIAAISKRIAVLYNADASTVQAYVQAAVNLESRTGIAAAVVVAIAIHESSFNSPLFSNSGNPFGIKASKPWTGATFSKFHDGEETKFRSYSSPEEAVSDFGDFINSRKWYADALACSIINYRCIIDGLKKTEEEVGYSMNPNWDEAVLGIISKIGLQALDAR